MTILCEQAHLSILVYTQWCVLTPFSLSHSPLLWSVWFYSFSQFNFLWSVYVPPPISLFLKSTSPQFTFFMKCTNLILTFPVLSFMRCPGPCLDTILLSVLSLVSWPYSFRSLSYEVYKPNPVSILSLRRCPGPCLDPILPLSVLYYALGLFSLSSLSYEVYWFLYKPYTPSLLWDALAII